MKSKINHLEEQENEPINKECITINVGCYKGIYYIESVWGSEQHPIDKNEVVLFLNVLDKLLPEECVFECNSCADESLDDVINYLKSIGAKEIESKQIKRTTNDGTYFLNASKCILSKEVIKLLMYRGFSDIDFRGTPNIVPNICVPVFIRAEEGKEYFYSECFEQNPESIIFYISHDFDYYMIKTPNKTIKEHIIKVIKNNAKVRNLNVKIKTNKK